MRILVAGGTGLIGKYLVKALKQDGHSVTIVSRQAGAADTICWNQISQEGLPKGTDAVIQLAGHSILKLPRWTEDHKKEVLQSRLDTAGMLIGAMQRAPPQVFIVASAVGYYPSNTAEPLAEDAEPGNDFPAMVCREVEKLVDTAAAFVPRIVKMRIGVVLSKQGGALQQMWRPFSFGLGGTLGSGTQPFPWIHIADVVGLYKHVLERNDVSGPVNAVAPGCCTNYEFTKALGQALNRPTILPVPAFVMQWALGEESSLLLDGQNVTPAKALQSGYAFHYPAIADALISIRDNPDF